MHDDGGLEDDFGGADLPAPTLATAPPPPPAPDPRTQPSPPPKELVELARQIGQSADALERQTLAHQALLSSMADVLADPTISASERRKEMRVIAAAAARLFPYARLFQAEQTVKQARDDLENRRRQRAGARVERRPTAGDGKVIPLRGLAVPDGVKSK
jgi:hypothetical protein